MTLLDRMRQAILQGAKEPEVWYMFGEAASRIEELESVLAALLDKLDTMTTEDFRRGAERVQREAARTSLKERSNEDA